MRLLDVGCGWGGMVMHAAREYGVRALGVTLSRRQAEWAQKAIAEAGLGELAEVRHLDYRDVEETQFDAISSIGLTEHIGLDNLTSYFRFLHARLFRRPPAHHCSSAPHPAGSSAAYHPPYGSRTASCRRPAGSWPRCRPTASSCSTRDPARDYPSHRSLFGEPRRHWY